MPEIGIGNKPIDDGNYLFLPEEKEAFLQLEPEAEKYFMHGAYPLFSEGKTDEYRWRAWEIGKDIYMAGQISQLHAVHHISKGNTGRR